MQDYNKVKPLNSPKPAASAPALPKLLSLRYWILLLVVLIGFSMHLTSQVWQNSTYQKASTPLVLNSSTHTKTQVTLTRGKITHSFYRAITSAGLSAKQALQLQKNFAPYVNYQSLNTGDPFQVLTDESDHIVAASLQVNQKRYIFAKRPNHQIQFLAQSITDPQAPFNLQEFYLAQNRHPSPTPLTFARKP